MKYRSSCSETLFVVLVLSSHLFTDLSRELFSPQVSRPTFSIRVRTCFMSALYSSHHFIARTLVGEEYKF